MKKKILSAVLALCLAFGSAAALPQSAFVDSTSIAASAETTATSGKCGDNLSWTLKNGVLTISGTGDMYGALHYGDTYNSMPFFKNKSIKSVVVKTGVTSICDPAFYGCTNLTSVSIPGTVEYIGSFAFTDCSKLKKLTIENGVKEIDENAFQRCSGLTSLTIPGSVKKIGVEAFYGCTGLTSVNLQNGVTSLGNSSFGNCDNLKSVTIPKTVNSIGRNAFEGTKWLKNQQKKNPLVVVNGILVDAATCSGNVVIPNSVKSIGENAFAYCEGLTGVTIPNSVTNIGDSAFIYCKNLKSITIPKSVDSLGADSFFMCTNLTSVTIQNGVKTIGEVAFNKCTNLKSISIPSSVTSFGYGAFTGTKWLENKQKQNPLVVVNGILIDGTKCSGKVTIPNNVTSIGDGAFNNNENLTSVTIPNGVTTIGENAFLFCSNLISVTIPRSVTSIQSYAFSICPKLKSVTIWSSFADFGINVFSFINTLVTIYGIKGTVVEEYAKSEDYKFVALNVTEPKTVRYAGSDRAQTASLISKGMYKTADTVVLATGFDFHDALAAVPLASAYNAPLLLADRDNLSAKTLAEIKRLKAKNIIVVATTNAKDANGNSAAIGKNVYKQLSSYKVTKITGSSYYETAKNVAKNLKTKTGKNPTSVFVTTDKNYADALSASPVAAILGAPILYVKSIGALNSNTTAYLKSIKSSVKNIYIVGGVNAVSKDVVAKIKTVLPNKKVTRFDGTDRYETCIKINKAFASTLSGKAVCVAKGYNFPDALAGGVFAAKQKAPLFLADKLDAKATISKTQANYLYIKNPSKLYIFGGETAVPTALVKTIAKASV